MGQQKPFFKKVNSSSFFIEKERSISNDMIQNGCAEKRLRQAFKGCPADTDSTYIFAPTVTCFINELRH